MSRLLPTQYRISEQLEKWPPGVDPGGHSYVFLKVSINNKPDFLSEDVVDGTVKLIFTVHHDAANLNKFYRPRNLGMRL
jgi:hypothetical protein